MYNNSTSKQTVQRVLRARSSQAASRMKESRPARTHVRSCPPCFAIADDAWENVRYITRSSAIGMRCMCVCQVPPLFDALVHCWDMIAAWWDTFYVLPLVYICKRSKRQGLVPGLPAAVRKNWHWDIISTNTNCCIMYSRLSRWEIGDCIGGLVRAHRERNFTDNPGNPGTARPTIVCLIYEYRQSLKRQSA